MGVFKAFSIAKLIHECSKESELLTALLVVLLIDINIITDERTHIFTQQLESRDKTIAELKKKMEELAKQAAEAR